MVVPEHKPNAVKQRRTLLTGFISDEDRWLRCGCEVVRDELRLGVKMSLDAFYSSGLR